MMGSPLSPDDRGRLVLAWAFARLDTVAFVLASAVTFALLAFALTAAIVLKGAPTGAAVGPHLAELAFYLPGYSVTLVGAVIGAAYAFLGGAAWGFLLATLWNGAHALLLAVIRVRATLRAYSFD